MDLIIILLFVAGVICLVIGLFGPVRRVTKHQLVVVGLVCLAIAFAMWIISYLVAIDADDDVVVDSRPALERIV